MTERERLEAVSRWLLHMLESLPDRDVAPTAAALGYKSDRDMRETAQGIIANGRSVVLGRYSRR